VEIALGILIGLIIGGAVAFGLARMLFGGGAGAVRLRTQLEERDRRLGELQADLEAAERELQHLVAEKSALDARREEAEKKIAQFDALRERIEKQFKAAADAALRANSESFIKQAQHEMEGLLTRADVNIGKTLQPVSDTLKRYEAQLKLIEEARTDAYGGLKERLERLAQQNAALQKETSTLSGALKNPQVQGRWGEMALKNAVELAGMTEHCDFTEQTSVARGEDRQRPDMIVRLPAGRVIVIDSKAPLKDYVEAAGAPTPEAQKKLLERHAAKVREHMRTLASKAYASQFERAPEFTVMFLPGENFFAAAVKQDPALLADAMNRHIVLTTPTTLIALLLAVAQGWREVRLEENARKISALGAELYDRMRVFMKHLGGVGRHLGRAVRDYSGAVRSFESRVRPQAQKLKELGATGAADLPPLSEPGDALRLPEIASLNPDAPDAASDAEDPHAVA
jgi:DNA recombination protein RmuC